MSYRVLYTPWFGSAHSNYSQARTQGWFPGTLSLQNVSNKSILCWFFFFFLTGIIFITFTEPSMQHLFYFIFLYVPDYVFTSNFCTVKMTWIHVWFSKRCTVRFLFRFLKTILKPTISDVGTPPGGTRVTFDYFNNSRSYGQRSCYTTQLLRTAARRLLYDFIPRYTRKCWYNNNNTSPKTNRFSLGGGADVNPNASDE